MTFDAVLQLVGGSGVYQVQVLVIAILGDMLLSMESIIPVFIAVRRPYNCTQSGLNCSFAQQPMTSTIQSKYGLTCSKEAHVIVSQVVFFFGLIVGSLLFGKLSDSYGRRPSVLASCGQLWITSIGTAFAQSFWLYTVLRFFTGIASSGLSTVLVTIATEISRTDLRVFWAANINQGWSLGIVIMSLVAYLVRDQFVLQLALFGPSIGVGLAFYFFIRESPRWLFVKRRTQELQETLDYIAHLNRRFFPKDFDIKTFYVITTRKSKGLVDLYKFRALRKVFWIVGFDFFVINLCFIWLSINVGELGGNLFFNTAVTAALEIPSHLLSVFLLQRVGRVPTLVFIMAIAGIGNFLYGFVHFLVPSQFATVAWLGIARLCYSMCLNGMWVFSTDIFATEVRNSAVGASVSLGRTGGAMAPLVKLLGWSWPQAPWVLLGLLSLIASVVSSRLPETKSTDQPDTLEESEELAKGCC